VWITAERVRGLSMVLLSVGGVRSLVERRAL
jgi:hypothetical protein